MVSQWLQTNLTRVFGKRLDVVVGKCYTCSCNHLTEREGNKRGVATVRKLPCASSISFDDLSTLQRLSNLYGKYILIRKFLVVVSNYF